MRSFSSRLIFFEVVIAEFQKWWFQESLLCWSTWRFSGAYLGRALLFSLTISRAEKNSFKLHILRDQTRHWFLWLRLSAGLAPDRYWSRWSAVIPICTHMDSSCARTCSFAFLARENNRPWTFQRPWWATDPVPSIIGTQSSRKRARQIT